MKVRFQEAAESDLDEIWYFIALDDPRAATRVIDFILVRLKTLQAFPGAGRERDELAPGLRSWPIGSYVVYYRATKRELRIVRILHGRRDAQNQIWDPLSS